VIYAPLVTVARRLSGMREKAVFVGGMVRGLLITDPAASPHRLRELAGSAPPRVMRP
jgi:hypothetical protein